MKIEEVVQVRNRDKYRELFLIGDEDEGMLKKYLYEGKMYLLFDNGLRGGIIVIRKNDSTVEIKNISIFPEFHRCGYGQKLIAYIENKYKNKFNKIIVGTGDSPLTMPFYKSMDFKDYFVVKDFFTKNYEEPIYEGGVLLKDMIYLEKNI